MAVEHGHRRQVGQVRGAGGGMMVLGSGCCHSLHPVLDELVAVWQLLWLPYSTYRGKGGTIRHTAMIGAV